MKVSENWGTLIEWQNRNTKSGLIGGSTSLWSTITAPVKKWSRWRPGKGKPDLQVVAGASWRARWQQGKFDLRSASLWSLARVARCTTGTASSHLGMGIRDPGAGSRQRRGEGQSWRDVVKAGAGRWLNNLAALRGFIYPRELEVRQNQCIPECWTIESRAHERAEELTGRQESAVLIYKLNLSFNLFGNFIGKKSLKWITKGVKVLRRGVEDGESQDAAWNTGNQKSWYIWTSLDI